MRNLYVILAAPFAVSLGSVPAGASLPAEAVPASEQTLKHSITFIGAAAAYPTPIDNGQNIVFLKVTVNGHDAWALLDNAFDHTVIDLAFAKSIGLSAGPVVSTLNLGEAAVDERIVEGASIAIPGQVLLSGSIMATDMQPFARIVGRQVQVIIGGDYLNRMAVLIQTSRKEMILAKSGAITPRGKVATLPLVNGNEVFARVNGKPAALTVDMGFNGTLRLSSEAWARIVPAGAIAKESKTATFDGTVRASTSVENATLELGPVSVDRVTVSVGAKMPKANDGLLGMAFLAKTDFILDVDQGKLILIPIESSVTPTAAPMPPAKAQ